MSLAEIPTFAIVGHPNKGKSSIVATLAQDSSVDISAASGTTIQQRAYPMQVDGKVLYRLIDTPGFQRARAAMDWMQKQHNNAADHAVVVRQFVEAHRDDPKFIAEVELLDPLINGAGILYVVDGSKPYGPEYDTEMEILRWSGQPSMALINSIGETDFSADWQAPLSQYFKIVRTFDAQRASFDRQVQLLTGFSELSDQWHQPLQQASAALLEQRRRRIDSAANRIADMLLGMLQCVEKSTLRDPKDQAAVDKLVQKYQASLKEMERTARVDVEQLFNYNNLDRQENTLAMLTADLFSEQSWQVFGLSRDQLMTTGVIGGAAAGGLLDLGSGGLTMFLGSGLGAVIGGASVWFGSQQLVDTKVMGLPMGDHMLQVGPVSNANFPWVVLGRAATHLRHITHRNHARQDALALNQSDTQQQDAITASSISASKRGQLDALFNRARKGNTPNDSELATLASAVMDLVSES